MLLKTTLRRAGGSFHEIDGITYHFTGPGDAPHVCEVAAQAHVKRFLAIDGFEVADAVFEAPTQPALLSPAEEVALDAVIDDLLARGPGAMFLEAVEAKIAAPVQPADSILDGTDAVAEPAPLIDYESMDDDELDEAFHARFGKPPHPKAKRPSIIRTLVKADNPEPAED